jgi:hypothetical protein
MSNKMNLSPELEARVLKLSINGQTPNEVLEQVVSLGCYQLEYRRKANPKKAQAQKEGRELTKLVKANPSKYPELAKQLGIVFANPNAVTFTRQ